MVEETWRHEALWRNNDIMRERLKDAGFDTGPSETPIIPAVVGDDMAAFKMCSRMAEEGVFVNPVVSPAATTVPIIPMAGPTSPMALNIAWPLA